MKPNDAQVKVFWEWYGFEWHNLIGLWHDPIHGLVSSILPPIDLKNLFKYAVPRLNRAGSLSFYRDGTYGACINSPHIEVDGSDPADALFWALDRMRESDDTK